MDATAPEPTAAGGADEPDRAEVKPLDLDGVGALVVGTVLWAVALVVMLVFRSDLEANDNSWWLWTCLAGFVLGLGGIAYTRWRRDAINRVKARQAASQ